MKKLIDYFKKHNDTAVIVILLLIFGPMYLIGRFADNDAQSKVDQMLSSSDPVGQLIVAINSNKVLDFIEDPAIEALDKIGDPLLIALAPACSGEIVSSSPYDPNITGPHPLVLLYPNGHSHPSWTYDLLQDWGPASRQAQDVELVVCVVEDYRRRLDTCQYVGLEIIHVQNVMKLRIVEAATGKTVASIEYEGSKPSGWCPINPKGSGTEYKAGSFATRLSKVRKWLKDYVD